MNPAIQRLFQTKKTVKRVQGAAQLVQDLGTFLKQASIKIDS